MPAARPCCCTEQLHAAHLELAVQPPAFSQSQRATRHGAFVDGFEATCWLAGATQPSQEGIPAHPSTAPWQAVQQVPLSANPRHVQMDPLAVVLPLLRS